MLALSLQWVQGWVNINHPKVVGEHPNKRQRFIGTDVHGGTKTSSVIYEIFTVQYRVLTHWPIGIELTTVKGNS